MLNVSLRNLLITFSSLCLSSVLNHCEVHRVAAVVYQCYSDVIGPDSVTMETYKPALTHLGKSVQVSCFSEGALERSVVRKRRRADARLLSKVHEGCRWNRVLLNYLDLEFGTFFM